MITRKWTKVPVKENMHKLDARDIYHDENAQIVHLNMQPGEELVPHKTPVDVVFYVLEGTGKVFIGKEEKEVDRDTLIESPKNIVHYWKNTGDDILRIMVIKVPSPIRSKSIK